MKTSELTGAAIDWAVAKCEGVSVHIKCAPKELFYTPKGKRSFYIYRPSTNWAQGGPIIEREEVSIACRPKDARGLWCAVMGRNRFLSPDYEGFGPTPLIAAMRCYVASKLGDEVEIPENLQ